MALIKASAHHPSLDLFEAGESGLNARARRLRSEERNPLV
jgi:hypothetical protein